MKNANTEGKAYLLLFGRARTPPDCYLQQSLNLCSKIIPDTWHWRSGTIDRKRAIMSVKPAHAHSPRPGRWWNTWKNCMLGRAPADGRRCSGRLLSRTANSGRSVIYSPKRFEFVYQRSIASLLSAGFTQFELVWRILRENQIARFSMSLTLTLQNHEQQSVDARAFVGISLLAFASSACSTRRRCVGITIRKTDDLSAAIGWFMCIIKRMPDGVKPILTRNSYNGRVWNEIVWRMASRPKSCNSPDT